MKIEISIDTAEDITKQVLMQLIRDIHSDMPLMEVGDIIEMSRVVDGALSTLKYLCTEEEYLGIYFGALEKSS